MLRKKIQIDYYGKRIGTSWFYYSFMSGGHHNAWVQTGFTDGIEMSRDVVERKYV